MGTIKTTVLLVTFVALFFTGGMANAFSTCPMNMDKASAEMQMDADMDMPCHETKDSEDRSSEQCDGCDCQHCVQTNALPIEEVKDHHGGAAVGILADQLLSSCQIETHFRPPKRLS